MGISAKRAAILLLPLLLAACAGAMGQTASPIPTIAASPTSPLPTNYRPDLLAFLKTYLNNPVGVKEALIAEPVQRTVSGRLRYVVCLRYNPKDTTSSNYLGVRERAVLYVDARLDRVVEDASEICAGAAYAPFPEMEKMVR